MNNTTFVDTNTMASSIPHVLDKTISFETFEACVTNEQEPVLSKQSTNGFQKWIIEKKEKISKQKTALKAVRSGQLKSQIII